MYAFTIFATRINKKVKKEKLNNLLAAHGEASGLEDLVGLKDFT